jgi:hypothetical protein
LELTMDKKERNRGSVDRARAKRATPPNNERRERVGQVLLRNLLDRGETEDTAADFARRSDATSRMNRPPQGMRPAIAGKDFSPRPMPRPTRAPEESMRPVTRPDDALDRMEERRMRDTIEMGNRQDPGMSRREMERGFKAGGMVTGTGSRAQISGTKFSGTF